MGIFMPRTCKQRVKRLWFISLSVLRYNINLIRQYKYFHKRGNGHRIVPIRLLYYYYHHDHDHDRHLFNSVYLYLYF